MRGGVESGGMESFGAIPPLQLIRSSSAVGEVRLDRDAAFARIRRGVYIRQEQWDEAGYEAKHFGRMLAVAGSRSAPVVFSHASAALLWGLPVVGPFLRQVHLATVTSERSHSEHGVQWHHDAITDDDVVELGGFLVTSFERTVIDLACALPFVSAVAVLDRASMSAVPLPAHGGGAVTHRPGVTKEWLLETLVSYPGRRGIRSARISAEFSNPLSGSPGESISRAGMHLLHFPPPVLQQEFPRANGSVDIADFDWPEYGAFGEFDGFGKYVREEFTHGKSIEQVVTDEKQRENRIRVYRPRAARWEWKEALSLPLLRSRLMDAGLRPLQ